MISLIEVGYCWCPCKDCYSCFYCGMRLALEYGSDYAMFDTILHRSICSWAGILGSTKLNTDCLLRVLGKLWSRCLSNIISSLSFKESTGFSTIHRMTEICSQIPMICYATLDKSHNLSICFPICPLYIITRAWTEMELTSYEKFR